MKPERLINILLLLAWCLGLAGPAPAEPLPNVTDEVPPGFFQESYTHNAMATQFEIVIYAERDKITTSHLDRVAEEAFTVIDSLEARISTWRQSSQASRVNREAAERPIRVAADIFGVVKDAQTFYRDTCGAFDITVGPLVELWRTCKEGKRLPTAVELDAAKSLTGFDKVTLDPATNTIAYARKGMRMDFGGIGKGLALDEVARVLREYGVSRAILHGGASSILALGAPPGKDGWTVRVQHPLKPEEDIATFQLHDESFSSSGHVQDLVEIEGKQYGHIINPATGMLVQGMAMAMAIAPTGTETDALSTAFFVMGTEGTRRYCEQHAGVRAVLVPRPESGELEPVRIGFPE